MRNIVLLLLFIIVLNMMGTLVMGQYAIRDYELQQQRMDVYLEEFEAQNAQTQDTELQPSTQSQYTTDLLPFMDYQGGGEKTFEYLRTGVNVALFGYETDNITTKMINRIITLSLVLLNIISFAWLIVFLWGKQIHT